jgi:hypothetical protein
MFESRMMMMKGEENEEMKTRCELWEKRAIHLNRKNVACGAKSLGESENRHRSW